MGKNQNYYRGFDFVSRNFQRVIKAWLKKYNHQLAIPYEVIKINNKHAVLRLTGIRYLYVKIRNYRNNRIEVELIVSMGNKGMSYGFDDAIIYYDAEPRLRLDGLYICQMCNNHIAGSSEIYSDIDDLLNRHVLAGLKTISDDLNCKPYLHYLLDEDGEVKNTYLSETPVPLRPNYKDYSIQLEDSRF